MLLPNPPWTLLKPTLLQMQLPIALCHNFRLKTNIGYSREPNSQPSEPYYERTCLVCAWPCFLGSRSGSLVSWGNFPPNSFLLYPRHCLLCQTHPSPLQFQSVPPIPHTNHLMNFTTFLFPFPKAESHRRSVRPENRLSHPPLIRGSLTATQKGWTGLCPPKVQNALQCPQVGPVSGDRNAATLSQSEAGESYLLY